MLKRLTLVLLMAFALITTGALSAQDNTLTVLATTTIIADVAQNVGGDLVTVHALIPANTDIHAFQPTPADVGLAASADLLLVNGVGLEAFLGDLLQGAVEPDARIVVVSNGVTILSSHHHDEAEATAEAEHDEHGAVETVGVLGVDATCGDLLAVPTAEVHTEGEDHDEHDHGPCDPHVWTDPTNVKIWADNIAAAFADADPANADIYQANAEAYKKQIDALDAEITETLAVLPEERRILVTNHEFLGYFASHYEFEIVGTVIPGLSTLAEPAPQELAGLVQTINAEAVPAIFIEASDPGRLANVVASEVGRDIQVLTLYSDSLSDATGPASTYIDYVRANAQTIADALK